MSATTNRTSGTTARDVIDDLGLTVGSEITFQSVAAQGAIPAGSILTGTIDRINKITISVGVGHSTDPNGYRRHYVKPENILSGKNYDAIEETVTLSLSRLGYNPDEGAVSATRKANAILSLIRDLDDGSSLPCSECDTFVLASVFVEERGLCPDCAVTVETVDGTRREISSRVSPRSRVDGEKVEAVRIRINDIIQTLNRNDHDEDGDPAVLPRLRDVFECRVSYGVSEDIGRAALAFVTETRAVAGKFAFTASAYKQSLAGGILEDLRWILKNFVGLQDEGGAVEMADLQYVLKGRGEDEGDAWRSLTIEGRLGL